MNALYALLVRPMTSQTPRPTGVVDLGAGLSTPLPDDHLFDKLVASPNGFALLGTDMDSGSILILGSADGRIWRRVATQLFGARVLDLAAGPNGWVVALSPGDEEDGAVRTFWSSDARLWLPVAPADNMDDVTSVSAWGGGPGYAITGQRSPDAEQAESWIWTSNDGRSWSPGSRLPPDADPEGIVITEGGFVALATGESGETPAAWTSKDGVSWSAQPASGGPLGEAGTWIRAASSGRDIVVLRGDGTVWITRPEPSANALRLDWEHVSAADRTFSGYRLAALTGAQPGYRALGWDRKTYVRKAWSSADGLDWQVTSLDATTFAGGVPELLAEGSSTSVALGSRTNEDGRAVERPWISANGLSWSEVDVQVFGALPPILTGPCPAKLPTTLEAIEKMTPELWPTCFGHRTLTLRAYVTACGGCGGTDMTDWSPRWLYDPMGPDFLLTATRMPDGTDGSAFAVRIDPARPVRVAFNVLADVSGHFADPASSTCRATNAEFIGGALPPRAIEVASCRREFVVESIRQIGH